MALLAALTLVLAACGDDDGADASPGTSGGSGSSDNGNEQSSNADGPSGTLRIGVATNVQSYDPQTAAVAQEYYVHPVFDTLVHANPDGSFGPGLAEDWEFTDRNTLVLNLRSDVAFSDGAALDADAVVANFERGRGMEASPSTGFYSNLAGVSALDDLTVQLDLVAPTTSMLDDLSRLPGMMMSPASFDANPETMPVGAGGWTLDVAASNPGEVQIYRANPTYWDPTRVKVETVEMRVLEDDASNNALLAGQIDIGELRSEADVPTFSRAGHQLISRPNANLWYVQIMDTDGTLLEPMNDLRVRQALNLAIDREAFHEGLQFGEGDPSPSVWLAETAYYDEGLEQWAYDPDRARQLLEEAGYPNGFSVTFPSFGAITPVAEAVQQMWAAIGIDVTVELVEPGTLAAVMRNGETVMTPTLARGFTAESMYKERMAAGSPYDVLGTDRGQLAELADAAYQAETEAEQQEAWREVYAYAIDQGYLLVIGHQFPRVVVADSVNGAVLRPSDNLPQSFDISVSG